MKLRSILFAALGAGFLLSASAPAFAQHAGGFHGGGFHGGGYHGGYHVGGWHAGYHYGPGWAWRDGRWWWGPRVVVGAPYPYPYYYPYYAPGVTLAIP